MHFFCDLLNKLELKLTYSTLHWSTVLRLIDPLHKFFYSSSMLNNKMIVNTDARHLINGLFLQHNPDTRKHCQKLNHSANYKLFSSNLSPTFD